MSVLYCFDEDTKKRLIENKYSLLSTTIYKGKVAYLFANNGKTINFSKGEVEYSNKLLF